MGKDPNETSKQAIAPKEVSAPPVEVKPPTTGLVLKKSEIPNFDASGLLYGKQLSTKQDDTFGKMSCIMTLNGEDLEISDEKFTRLPKPIIMMIMAAAAVPFSGYTKKGVGYALSVVKNLEKAFFGDFAKKREDCVITISTGTGQRSSIMVTTLGNLIAAAKIFADGYAGATKVEPKLWLENIPAKKIPAIEDTPTLYDLL
jgi:hypothetical protein